jgi:sugar phosphate isomerase/epimerase
MRPTQRSLPEAGSLDGRTEFQAQGGIVAVVALSTMWAQQKRFRGHMDAFARIAAAAGYTSIEPSHSTDMEGLDSLIDGGLLPLSSLHAPAPRERDARGRWNGDLNLAALDDDERVAALAATRGTIDYARRAGAAAVVLHLGGCGNRPIEEEARLRALFASGKSDTDEAARLRVLARATRERLARQHLPLARQSLELLAEYAERAGVSLGLENRLHYHEIPRWDEVPDLLAPYPSRLAGYWHDVGHAEVLHRLGLVDRSLWLSTNGARTIGSHLHDVAGIVDHRAPGEGDVRWDYIVAGLPPDAMHTVEINQHSPQPLLARGRRYLEDQGVLRPPNRPIPG